MNETVPFDEDTFSGDLTVSELTGIIKRLIEESLPVVSVVGELSNCVLHSSGHRYFTLKDEHSQLKCVLFKWQAGRLDFEPEEGMLVKVVGNVTVYERGGQYQLNVLRIQPLGRGELLLRLEELKKRLADEGVFANERPIPPYPSVVGIVTSPTGAAIRDIISVISRRAPHVQVILRPTLVQGAGAADDIVEAITDMNRYGAVDVLIVGRGGGSIEDLWCFNEDRVARAIAASRIPVVSAVGHETDYTLADYAADLRAPTPSAAGEIVVRDAAELAEKLASYRSFLGREVLNTADHLSQRVERLRTALSPGVFLRDNMMRSQQVDEYTMRLKSAFEFHLAGFTGRVEQLDGKLATLNPRGVLNRGYAIVTRSRDGRILTDAAGIVPGERILVDLARGSLRAEVEETNG